MQKFLTVGVDKAGYRKVLIGADQPYNKHKQAMAEAKVSPLPKGIVLIEQYVMSRSTSGIDAKAQKVRADGGLVPDDGRGLRQEPKEEAPEGEPPKVEAPVTNPPAEPPTS